jgi:tricorn protease interacting factor F2/3
VFEYEKYFGIRYPLPKLDMIAIPDFAAGAMENWGAITFREAILLYDPKTSSTRTKQYIAEVISHEIAHQWFGNLVTMKWWNDLWLNESFATYMSFLAMSNAPELSYFQGQWIDFMVTKVKGIAADQLNSTHPVMSEIAATNEAESVFDGISYGKGASFLKQVYNVMGEDTMKIALVDYFQKHEWQNTELTDFIDSLQLAYDKSAHKKMG